MQPGPFRTTTTPKPQHITVNQQNKLISLMRNYAPPGHPRSGPSIEYSEDFWSRAAVALNAIETDPRKWREKDKWRQLWRYYSTRVKKKINNNQKMTIFEEQVANVLQRNFLEESNIQIEDDNSVELIEVQPEVNDISDTFEAESINRPQKIAQRRKTVGFVEQASVDQARTSMERSRMSHYQNQMNSTFEPMPSTSYQDPYSSQAEQLPTPNHQEIKTEPEPLHEQQNPSNHEASTSNFQTTVNSGPGATASHQNPTSNNDEIKNEPGTSQAQPASSANQRNASTTTGTAMNGTKRKRDEQNSKYDEITQQLVAADELGKQMKKDLEWYNNTIRSIAENFQQLRRQDQEESSENSNNLQTVKEEEGTGSINPQTTPLVNGDHNEVAENNGPLAPFSETPLTSTPNANRIQRRSGEEDADSDSTIVLDPIIDLTL